MEEKTNTTYTEHSNEELKGESREKKAKQSLHKNMSFYKYYKAQQLFKLPEFEAMYKVIP